MKTMKEIYTKAKRMAQMKVFDADADRYIKVLNFCRYKLDKTVCTCFSKLVMTESGKLLKGTKQILKRTARNYQDYKVHHNILIDNITELGNKKAGIATHKYIKIWDAENNLIISKKIA